MSGLEKLHLEDLETAHDQAYMELVAYINDLFPVGARVRVRGGNTYAGAKKWVLRGVVAHRTESHHNLDVLIRSEHGRLHHRHYKSVEIDKE